MDSLIYHATGQWESKGSSCGQTFIDLTKQEESYQRNVFDRMQEQNNRVEQTQSHQTIHDHSTQSLLSNREMSFGEIPVIDNTFSLPQNVVERVLDQPHQRGSHVSPPATTLPETDAYNQHHITAVQRRRPSVAVTDLTGNEAKRLRLSPSQQVFTHQMHRQKNPQREQLKLQMIMQRLNNTRDKVLKLLKLQKARTCLNQHDNPAGRSVKLVKSQPRYDLLNRNVSPPSSFHGSVQEGHSVSDLPSRSQRARLLPGINIVSNRAKQGSNQPHYNTLESAGLALDHQTLPKLVAVHSVQYVVKNPSVAVTRCVPTDSRSLVGLATTVHKEYTTISAPPADSRIQPAYVQKTRDIRKFRTHSPLSSETSARDERLQNYKDDEVVLTKIIPGNARRSTSTSPRAERKQDEVDFTKCNKETKHSAYDKEHRSHDARHPDHSEHAVITSNVDHLRTVDRLGNTHHPRHSCIPENVNHSERFNHPGHVHNLEHEQHRGSFQNADPASELYLGGPPPYLPILNRSELIEREKKASQQPGETNPTSPRLAKTVLEISEKIVETRDRIKNETIDWKKSFLVKVEKRLIQKLRRAEHLTGEKTEIEDLRQEVLETVTKRKRSKAQEQNRRPSRQESVTEDVTGDTDDAMESDGQQRRSSRDSVTGSVTECDNDNENSIERCGTERTASRRGSLTEDKMSDANDAAESDSHRRQSIADCVTEIVTEGDSCNKLECHSQKERNCDQESLPDNLVYFDNVEEHVKLQKQAKMEKNIEKTESSRNEKEEKCKTIQNFDISHDKKVKVEDCENSPDATVDDKEEKINDRLTKDEQVRSNAGENQINVKLEATYNVDCVTIEHLQEAIAPQVMRKSERLETKRAEFAECKDIKKEGNDLANVSQEKVTLDIQHSQDKKECVTLRSNETERKGNIFETLSSELSATHKLNTHQPNLPATTDEASSITVRHNSVPAGKKTSRERDTAISKNMVTPKKRPRTCNKQALDVKPKIVDCERNIWSILRKKGIF